MIEQPVELTGKVVPWVRADQILTRFSRTGKTEIELDGRFPVLQLPQFIPENEVEFTDGPALLVNLQSAGHHVHSTDTLQVEQHKLLEISTDSMVIPVRVLQLQETAQFGVIWIQCFGRERISRVVHRFGRCDQPGRSQSPLQVLYDL